MHSFGGADGYTIIETLGYWLGNNEPSCIIEIYGKYNPELIQILKTELKQDSIMVVKDYGKGINLRVYLLDLRGN